MECPEIVFLEITKRTLAAAVEETGCFRSMVSQRLSARNVQAIGRSKSFQANSGTNPSVREKSIVPPFPLRINGSPRSFTRFYGIGSLWC
jgi:hypothetical protein